MCQSKSNIVEHLARLHAGAVTAEEMVDCGPRARPGFSVSLTTLAKRALAAAADRTGRSVSEVVERLLEKHAAAVSRREFDDAEAA
jgi:hypothetical protein